MNKNILPKTSSPKRYEIKLDIDLENFSYLGIQTVEIQVLENTKSIFLNSIGIKISHASLRANDKENHNLSVEYFEDDDSICPDGTVPVYDDLYDGVCVPLDFLPTQSAAQMFYLIYDVLLDGMSVDSLDWVGTFNDDTCVGAYQWNTNQCLNGVCTVVAMGDDGSEYSDVSYSRNGRTYSITFKFNFGKMQERKRKFQRDHGHGDGEGMDMGY